MTRKSAKRNSEQNLPRCQYHSHAGRRCRFPVSDARSPHCLRHASRLASSHSGPRSSQTDSFLEADLRADLPKDPAAFKSASQINDFLSALLAHLAQNRISARRAAVLAYITNQLLRTLPAIERELDAQSPQNEDTGPVIILDVPRPNREQTNQPS
jgi:hypothetical protein